MIKFNLQKALNGAKVITRDGEEVTQLSVKTLKETDILVGVTDSDIYKWNIDGTEPNGNNLFMSPEKLSGFICHHYDGTTMFFKKKPWKGMYADDLALIVDLSQFNVGHGLEG